MTAGRTASLGMYDAPELQAANDALWATLADRLSAGGVGGVPARLDRARPLPSIWADPGLLLAQCCGYPLVTTWRGRLRYVATPRYRAPGCDGSFYRSRVVVRINDPAASVSDLRGRRAAINERSSNSGMNLFRAMIAPIAHRQPFFASVSETGSHAASVRAVVAGAADVAAIDTITFAHLERHAPQLTGALRTIGWTIPSAGLPLVTSAQASASDVRLLRRALRAVAIDPALAATRDALLIDGFEVVRPARYDALLKIETMAARAGYPALA